MKVSEIGEVALVELISNIINKTVDEKAKTIEQLIVGIGDDAAAWHVGNSIQLATVDALVQNVHFTLDKTPWIELGWKALAVNISDIAAMGGIPEYALVSLGLSPDTEVDNVIELYEGMMKLARQQNMSIIGGDTDNTPYVSVTVTVLGKMGVNQYPLTRSSAKPGDVISVTGYLGTAAAGLEMLKNNLLFDAHTAAIFTRALLHPDPRVAEGQLLVKEGVRTAIDVSDGLYADLKHICRASRVGAKIEVNQLPIAPSVKQSFGDGAQELAISGGEDYELLFTADINTIANVKKHTKCPITIIGEITQENIGEVTFVDQKGDIFKPHKKGWEHFISK